MPGEAYRFEPKVAMEQQLRVTRVSTGERFLVERPWQWPRRWLAMLAGIALAGGGLWATFTVFLHLEPLGMLTSFWEAFPGCLGLLFQVIGLDPSMTGFASPVPGSQVGWVRLMLLLCWAGGAWVSFLLSPRRHITVFADPEGSVPLWHLRQENLGILRRGYSLLGADGIVAGRFVKAWFSVLAPSWRFEEPSGRSEVVARRVSNFPSMIHLRVLVALGLACLWFRWFQRMGRLPPAVVVSLFLVFAGVLVVGVCFGNLEKWGLFYTRFEILGATGRVVGVLFPRGWLSRRKTVMELESGALAPDRAVALGVVLTFDLGILA